jgi:TPR repeat protein
LIWERYNVHFNLSYQQQRYAFRMSGKSAEALFQETLESAMKGNIDACNYLGYLYGCGLGTKRDALLAKQWYQKAIDKGHKTAKTNMEDLDKYEEKKSMDINAVLFRQKQELMKEKDELKNRVLALEARVKLLERTLDEHQIKIIELEEDAVVVTEADHKDMLIIEAEKEEQDVN